MPNLTSLTLRNFKAFKEEQRIPIRPITLLYGQNSAGKSSIIDALLFMHHLAIKGSSQDDFENGFDFSVSGHSVRLGGVSDFIHGKIMTEDPYGFYLGCTAGRGVNATQMDFDFEGLLGGGLKEFRQQKGSSPWLFRSEFGDIMRFDSLAGQYWGNAEVNEKHPAFDLFIDEAITETESVINGICAEHPDTEMAEALQEVMVDRTLHTSVFRTDLIRNVLEEYSRLRFGNGMLPPRSLASEAHPAVAHYPTKTEEGLDLFARVNTNVAIDKNYSDYIDNRVLKLAIFSTLGRLEKNRISGSENIMKGLRAISYCGPLRATLELDSMFTPRVLENRSSDSEARMDVGGWAITEPALDYVNLWLQENQGGSARYSLKMKKMKISEDHEALKIDLEDVRRKIPVKLHEVGSGIGQVIPVLLAAAAYKDHLICVKQPELHLHPAIQANVADAFVRFASRVGKEDIEDAQTKFLVETHSEHLLLRLMRRIRESTQGKLKGNERQLRPEDVAVLYVENLGEHSIVREMPLNENGELVRDWPGGFFEEGLREVLQ
ncbi:MAG: DUF3696 domain-containing protein [Opitutaceae bacterium]|nr:DUF3696 domain-containing protein [Opitutaceae bacterium]MBP9913108.1 DUF3696 domain-containing protein [Opitutaceae bacterium]